MNDLLTRDGSEFIVPFQETLNLLKVYGVAESWLITSIQLLADISGPDVSLPVLMWEPERGPNAGLRVVSFNARLGLVILSVFM